MKLIQTKCPNCNADLQIDENLKVCYCTYCGSKVLIDDESITENINIKLDQTITHRSIDETKLKELEYENEIRRAQMENHAKLAADKQKLEREKQERYQAEMGSYQTKIGRWKIGLLLYFVINVIFVFVGPSVNASLGQTILIVWIFFIIVGLVILVILKSRKPKMK